MNEPEIELRFPDSESRAHKLDQEIEKIIPHLPQMPVPFSHFTTLSDLQHLLPPVWSPRHVVYEEGQFGGKGIFETGLWGRLDLCFIWTRPSP